MTDVLGRSWQMGTIQLDSQMPQRFGLTLHGRRQRRAHAVRDPPRAARLARALHRDPDRALRRRASRSGSRRCRSGSSRSARVTAARRTSSRGSWLEGYRVEVDERDETVGKRIRDAEVEKIPVTIVYGDKESDESLAVRERGGRAVDQERWTELLANTLLRCDSAQAGAQPSPPEPCASRRFNRVAWTRTSGRCLQRSLSFDEGGNESLVTRPLRPRRDGRSPIAPRYRRRGSTR